MTELEEALKKEADDWLQSEHTEMDWISHCLIEPSDDLHQAFQDDCPDIEDADEDEEYSDQVDELIVAAYYNKRGQ